MKTRLLPWSGCSENQRRNLIRGRSSGLTLIRHLEMLSLVKFTFICEWKAAYPSTNTTLALGIGNCDHHDTIRNIGQHCRPVPLGNSGPRNFSGRNGAQVHHQAAHRVWVNRWGTAMAGRRQVEGHRLMTLLRSIKSENLKQMETKVFWEPFNHLSLGVVTWLFCQETETTVTGGGTHSCHPSQSSRRT